MTELAAIAKKIEEVEEKGVKLEAELEEVKSKLEKQPIDPDDKARLLIDKANLAERLASHEKGLAALREKETLLTKAAQGAGPSAAAAGAVYLPAFRRNFEALLLQSHVNNPKKHLVDVVESRLTHRMIACSRKTMALETYQDAELLIGASTAAHFFTQHGLRVNGPLFPNPADGPASLLRASDGDGRQLVVKLLRPSVALDSADQPGGLEAAAFRVLRLPDAAAQYSLIEGEVILLVLKEEHAGLIGHSPGIYAAVKMPQYACTLATTLPLDEDAILKGGRDIYAAVLYIHSQGHAHNDLKGDNIVLDWMGRWRLGDFGSMVKFGNPIQSTTSWFAQGNQLGKPATAANDWYMFTVLLAVELCKTDWKVELSDGRYVPKEKLIQVIGKANSTELRELMEKTLKLALGGDMKGTTVVADPVVPELA